MTWNDAWSILNKDGNLVERPNQRQLAEAVFSTTTAGGTLLGEAPVGVGKSFAYLVPLAYRVKEKERCVVSTETTTLQDQLYDKDLPTINDLFGPFKFRSLKGRSWYLCRYRASEQNPIILTLGHRDLGDGEKRDVERILGKRLSEDDWAEVSGDADWCGQNKCKPEGCYSTAARARALDADIVVTNHALLRTHAEMEDGILGDFQHLVVDEAHTLEKVLIDGWAEELSPYHLWKSMEAVWDAIDATGLKFTHAGKIEEGERLMKEGIQSIVKLFELLGKRRDGDKWDDNVWRRESFALSEQYLSGSVDGAVVSALENYELQGPGRFRAAADIFEMCQKAIENEIKNMERPKRKVTKGRTACKRLVRVMDMVAESLTTRDGIVVRYGVPYAVIGEGQKAWKGEADVKLRCVPLDVSDRAYETIWKDLKSATLVSGTLRDETDGSFRYVVDSLGVKDARSVVVGSSFDFALNQLVYVTPGTSDPIDVVGARYSMDELVSVLNASRGRALVLFTANAEMEFAADSLRDLQSLGSFPHKILVQERGVSKQDLVDTFMEDNSSVLLGSKSFFTGVNFPGEACSIVVLAKFPLPQFNSLCKAQIAWWRKRGHPNWYDREALQVFKQANGRLIRNETDRGVVAILDQRASNPREKIEKLVGMEISATGSSVTSDLVEMEKWLNG